MPNIKIRPDLCKNWKIPKKFTSQEAPRCFTVGQLIAQLQELPEQLTVRVADKKSVQVTVVEPRVGSAYVNL